MYRGKEREKEVFDQKIERIDPCFFNAIANNNNKIKIIKIIIITSKHKNKQLKLNNLVIDATF